MQLELVGHHAVVTGGSRGIGRGIVLALARAGANVVTCYRNEGEAVETLARELKEIGGDHHLVRADLSDPSEVGRFVDEVRSRLGSIDILVNNAGVISHVPVEDLSLDEWSRVLTTNLTAPFQLIQQSLPMMGPGASIISIGSRGAVAGIPLRSHYTASKAGLSGLTRSLAKELGKRGIRVNLIAPGVIDNTDGKATDAERELYAKRYQHLVALNRFGTPQEIAGAVLFLASTLSTYVTGETIFVDGGM